MEKAFDLTSIRLTLRQGIAKGYWTLEDLDTPSMHWQENAKQFRLHYPRYEQPLYFNPLRDQPDQPAVEAGPDPRDFSSPAPEAEW